MDDYAFTDSFFSYFNAQLKVTFFEDMSEEEVDEILKKRLSYPRGKPIYYTDPLDDLEIIQQHSDYPIIREQLKFTIDHIEKWGIEQNIPNANSLTDFSKRLCNPMNTKIVNFYSSEKKLLEEVAILITDKEIDLEIRRNVLLKLLENDGLTQCIDNCYFLFTNAHRQLISTKKSKNEIYHLVRQYTTEVARETAASRPFALPKSYKETLCDIKKMSILSYENHAENYFLLYAKDNNFPINAIYDVIAINMVNIPNHFTLKKNYIKALKNRFNEHELISFLAKYYHAELFKNFSDSEKSYLEKTNFIENKLNALGNDPEFSLYEIVNSYGNLRDEEALKKIIIKRFMKRKWLEMPSEFEIQLANKKFHFVKFVKNSALNWLSWTNEENEIDHCFFLDLMDSNKPIHLNESLRVTLLEKIFNHLFVLEDNLKNLKIILDNGGAAYIEDYINPEIIVNLIKKSMEVDLISDVLKKLPETKIIDIFKKFFPRDSKCLLEKGFLKSNVQDQYSYLPTNYLLNNANEASKKDALEVTKDLIILFLKNGFLDFSNLHFPQLPGIHYLDKLDFSAADFSHCIVDQAIKDTVFTRTNLLNTVFKERITHCWFDVSVLENTIFKKGLDDISFIRSDLRKTKFLSSSGYQYTQLDLSSAKLSSHSFRDLLAVGVTDFIQADLKAVNFQARAINGLSLDFSRADLTEAALQGLDLSKIKFHGCNLEKSNLRNSKFSERYLDEHIQVSGAKLDFSVLREFYKKGINQFKECEIFLNAFDYFPEEKFYFKDVNFNRAKFLGVLFNGKLEACNLEETKFVNNPEFEKKDKALIKAIHFKKIRFVNTEFYNLEISDVTFSDCYLSGITLNNVEMSVNTLFHFYKQGYYDFSEVNKLRDKIQHKLSPFPLFEALLSKEVFIQLYHKGVRDFRASNLRGFYLAEVLISEAISEIDLKLEGAQYKQSLLGCSGRSHRATRSGQADASISSSCIFYFLVQKKGLQNNLISFSDLQLFLSIMPEKKPVAIREITLDHKPLFLLDQPNEISFYWAYPPDEGDLIKTMRFIEQSTKPQQRVLTEISCYFLRKYPSNNPIKDFADKVYRLGFRKGRLNYYDAQRNIKLLDLAGKPLSPLPKMTVDFPLPVLESSAGVEQTPFKMVEKQARRFKLYTIAAKMKQRAEKGLHSGVKQGAQYELGNAIMYLISVWIMSVNAPEPKNIDNNTKAALKRYAHSIIDLEADKKRASRYQRELTLRVAKQCIDRGECSDEALVQADIIDTLDNLRPDIVVGNEVFFEKSKIFFISIGNFFSDKFDEFKAFFKTIPSENTVRNPALRPPIVIVKSIQKEKNSIHRRIMREDSDPSQISDHFLVSSFNETLASKLIYTNTLTLVFERKICYWYDFPLLVRLLKDIESIFDELDYDLRLDPNFSESEFSGFLYDLWLTLDHYGVSSHSTPEFTLSLVANESFIQSFFNETYFMEGASYFNATEEEGSHLKKEEEEIVSTRKKRAINETYQPLFFSKKNNVEIYKTTNKETIEMLSSSASRSGSYMNVISSYIADLLITLKNLFFHDNESFFYPLNEKKMIVSERVDFSNEDSPNLKKGTFLLAAPTSKKFYGSSEVFQLNDSIRFISELNNKHSFTPDPINNASINNALISTDFFARFFFKLNKNSIGLENQGNVCKEPRRHEKIR